MILLLKMTFAQKLKKILFGIRYTDDKTRKLLLDKFDAVAQWYPLRVNSKQNDLEYFEEEFFQKHFGDQKLIQLIKSLGCTTINEINESRDDKKINVDELEINNSEVYYCNDTVDWVIYCSHEQTVTFGGATLLQELKQQWSDWYKFKDPWAQYL